MSIINAELLSRYDIQNKEYIEERSIKINMGAVQQGLIKTVGAVPFSVLIAIISYLDVEGEAFPSQRKLAEITGLSKTTINKAIKTLLETEVNGKPLITRELETLGGRNKFSVYSLVDDKVEAKPKAKSSRDYVSLFKKLFEEEFNFTPVINWGRDCSLVKSKLMASYTPEEVETIITRGIKEYKSKWAKTKYPYPSLVAICTWIADVIIKEIKAEQEETKKQEEIMHSAIKEAEQHESRATDFFSNL